MTTRRRRCRRRAAARVGLLDAGAWLNLISFAGYFDHAGIGDGRQVGIFFLRARHLQVSLFAISLCHFTAYQATTIYTTHWLSADTRCWSASMRAISLRRLLSAAAAFDFAPSGRLLARAAAYHELDGPPSLAA